MTTVFAARQAQRTERRTLILALLEAQPYATADLAALIHLHAGVTSGLCKQLARDGCIARLADWRWSFVSATGRVRSKGVTPGAGRPRLIVKRSHLARAEAIIRYVPPVDVAAQFPTERVIDGQTFAIVFDGRQETPEWPLKWASSLAGCAKPDL